MDGVGHGTELAERYRLEERLLTTRTWQFWRAVDTTLERPVGVMLLDPSTALETTDAARRAALVEDPRLLRVLDAGTEDVHRHPVTYVVCEFVDGVSLETLLLQAGTLGADTVRTMVGEAAQALAHAAANGLHHGRLRPSSVLRTPDGSVKVAGLAIEAAAAGGVGPADPARADALALVGLIYAGLTGRWPLRTDVPGGTGLEPAPMVSGVPVPPGDLVSGVPNDLDTLCAVTFGPHNDGPRSPAEVAEELRPWRGQGEPAVPAAATPPAAATTQGTAAPPAPAGSPAARRLPADRTMRPPSKFPVRLAAGAASMGAAAAAADAAAAAGGGPGAGAPPAGGIDFGKPTGRDEGGSTQQFDPFADEAPVAAASAGLDPFLQAEPIGQPDPVGPYGDHATDDLDAYDEAPPRDPRVVIGVVAAAVAVVVGLWFALGALLGPDEEEPAASETTPPAGGTTSAPVTTSPTETTPAETPIQLATATALDPGGDGSENSETAADAIDGDPGTVWNSETYNSAAFGGLKDGLGLAVSLGDASTVSAVTLTMNGSSGSVELRTAPGASFDDSTVVANADVSGGPVVLILDEPVEAQHLVLWFTELPDVGGEFRIELAEVDVR